MPSVEYQKLVQSVAGLKVDLMGFAPNPIGTYTNTELLMCQSFVVFSHAEIQVYWEAVARRILTEAEHKWKNNQEVGRVVATLLAYRRPKDVYVPRDTVNAQKHGKFDWILSEAIKNQNEVIKDNNGIKRSNISEMLLPLGVFLSDLVEALLIQLDQTGTKRGTMVHKSSKVSLRTIRDPFADEMQDIDDLVAEIGAFDTKLETMGLLSVPTVQAAPVAVAPAPAVAAAPAIAAAPPAAVPPAPAT